MEREDREKLVYIETKIFDTMWTVDKKTVVKIYIEHIRIWAQWIFYAVAETERIKV